MMLAEPATEGFLPEPSSTSVPTDRQAELITERYPDGSVKIERYVAQDAEGNYVNHGSYTEYDRYGRLVRSGEFRNGRQHGKWVRYFQAGQYSLFSGDLEDQFQGPFVSEATFEDGKLHGDWIIRSRSGQKVIQWHFEQGQRHGKSTWWYPTGELRREVTYKNGEPEGELIEWSRTGEVQNRVVFLNGRPLVHEIKWYAPKQKAYEGDYLLPPVATMAIYDWWEGTAKAIPVTSAGPKQKHGQWTAWYPNGQIKATGSYEADVPHGKFTWWYPNGQKQAEGEYAHGQREGVWFTWHPNGQKESEGLYKGGILAGKWCRWQADGRRVEVLDHSPEAEDQAGPASPQTPSATTQPSVRQPEWKAETSGLALPLQSR